jgi:hypothetical protein
VEAGVWGRRRALQQLLPEELSLAVAEALAQRLQRGGGHCGRAGWAVAKQQSEGWGREAGGMVLHCTSSVAAVGKVRLQV